MHVASLKQVPDLCVVVVFFFREVATVSSDTDLLGIARIHSPALHRPVSAVFRQHEIRKRTVECSAGSVTVHGATTPALDRFPLT